MGSRFWLGRWLWLLAVLLAGCKDEATQLRLRDRQFMLQSQTGAPLLAGASVSLFFATLDLSFDGGCNQHFGKYTLRGGFLAIKGMGHTEMGCEGNGYARDAWLEKFLMAGPRLTLAGNTLTLEGDRAKLVLLDRVAADPDRPLQQTAWGVSGYTHGDTYMGLLGIEPPRLVFLRDGSFTLRSACVDGEGRYTVRGAAISISGASFAPRPCQAENDQVAARFVRTVLSDGELTYRIKARTLTLQGAGQALDLRDTRKP